MEFKGVPIRENPDYLELWSNALKERIPGSDYQPDYMWVGPDFIANYFTQCMGILTTLEQAGEWLVQHGEWQELDPDSHQGRWLICAFPPSEKP